MDIPSYPKIKDLEVNLVLLKLPEVVVTEKIHGANFRLFIPKNAQGEADVKFGAKDSAISSGSYFEQFLPEVKQIVHLNKVAEKLKGSGSQWVLFGEIYGQKIQKELHYTDLNCDISFFDIMKDNQLITYDEFKKFASRLGLNVVPELYRGKPSMEVFKRLINEPSMISKKTADKEGIVIRDPHLTLVDGNLPIVKFKNERFREKNYMFSVEDFERMADEEEKVRIFMRNFVTEVRIRKMADKLREHGKFTKSLKDIPEITKLLLEDIKIEDVAYYKSLNIQLLERFLPQKVNAIYTGLLKLL